jgi:streptomycin 6-kinase
LAAEPTDLEDLLPSASTSAAAGERRTKVKREDTLGPRLCTAACASSRSVLRRTTFRVVSRARPKMASVVSIFDGIRRLPTLDFAALQSAEGCRWVDGLADLAADLCREWGLVLEPQDLRNGYHAAVVPAAQGDEKYVLKIAWPAESIAQEELALRTWAGRGAVRLQQSDLTRGALLLERLDPTHSLADLPIVAAAAEAGELLRQMSVPAPAGIRTSAQDAETMVRAIQLRRALLSSHASQEWVDIALSIVRDSSQDAGTTLVHGDLHYGNVLSGQRQRWVAIDPKPIAGDPERAVAELLFTRVDELATDDEIRQLLMVIVDAGVLNAKKAVRWGFARTLNYWLWAIEQGLTIDPPRCHRVLRALEPLLR